MAHLLQSQSFISRSAWTEPRLQHHQAHTCIKLSDHHHPHHGSRKVIYGKKGASGAGGHYSFNGCVVQCCTSSSPPPPPALISSAKAGVNLTGKNADDQDSNGRWKDTDQEQPLYLASEYGWKVRRLEEEDQLEMRKVAQIQAEAFHQPIAFFDDLFFQFFKVSLLYPFYSFFFFLKISV